MQLATFDDIARDLSPSLQHYLRRLVGDHAVADDLLQETLLRVARALPGFDARASLKTWAFSIATNAAADYFRKPEHRLKIVAIEAEDDWADETRSVDERIVVDEMNACVRQVIDSLPEDYRAALVLHDLEDLSVEQTAGICGCSLATAKIRIHRGRQRLKQALQRQCSFYRDGDNVLRCDRKA
ncbi:MAG TPA: RNA polymerase sigma factor [Noviherbaspirillum sp.]